MNCRTISGDATFSIQFVTFLVYKACGTVVLNCFVFHLNFFHGFLFPWSHLLHLKWDCDRARLIRELFEYLACGPSVEHTLHIRRCSSFSSLGQLIVKACLHHCLFEFATWCLTGFTLSPWSQIVGNLVFLAVLAWLCGYVHLSLVKSDLFDLGIIGVFVIGQAHCRLLIRVYLALTLRLQCLPKISLCHRI